MGEIAIDSQQDEENVTDLPNGKSKKMVDMENPFKAFQTISQHGDLVYCRKLGKALLSLAESMELEVAE